MKRIRNRTHPGRPARGLGREQAATLPTDDQIARAQSELDAVLAVVEAIRRRLDALPTVDRDRSPVGNARAFRKLRRAATTRPVLDLAVSMARRTSKRATPPRTNQERRAQELCQLINSWI